MTDALPRVEFGPVLKEWRNRRRRSQLTLAGDAGVSQRHISFLETGRAKPSREMVVHLGHVLEVPLRERNAMLTAAGFAPVYAERSLDDPELAAVRESIQSLLDAHDPFPAYLVDRGWNMMLANAAAGRLIGLLPETVQQLAGNLLRLVCHPNGLRQVSPTWLGPAGVMLRRLESELAAHPNDEVLAALAAEVFDYPDVPDSRALATVPPSDEVLVPLTIALDEGELSFYTTITSLMGPVDITLEEVRLETLLPADRSTADALRQLADQRT